MYLIAKNWSKKYKILKFRRNLISFKSHAWIVIFMWSYTVVDQLANKALEDNYQNLGTENVFKIWWTWHFAEKILMYFVKNLFIIFDAKKNFPEFDGHFGRIYPGSEKPRTIVSWTQYKRS